MQSITVLLNANAYLLSTPSAHVHLPHAGFEKPSAIQARAIMPMKGS
jgi:superfamily II DNA/RNA helicase